LFFCAGEKYRKGIRDQRTASAALSGATARERCCLVGKALDQTAALRAACDSWTRKSRRLAGSLVLQARECNYRTRGGSPPTMTTSAGRLANRPTLTTPGIWLICCSILTGSVMERPWTSRIQFPLSVTTPWPSLAC